MRPRTWRRSLTTELSSPPRYWAGVVTRGSNRSTAWRSAVLYIGRLLVGGQALIMADAAALVCGASAHLHRHVRLLGQPALSQLGLIDQVVQPARIAPHHACRAAARLRVEKVRVRVGLEEEHRPVR